MFEKEAEEYLKKDGTKAEQILDMLNETSPLKIKIKQLPYIFAMIQQIYQDGAEYGYNKALEEATHNYNAIIADYDKRIADLEKENAELKKQLEMSYKVYNDNLDYSYHIEGQLTNAIETLERENAELKKELEEWKKCFLSCSSPFCNKHFPTVESSGVLGNMEKKENLKRGIK